ncbi:hypothetical protein ElyMa_003802800 [Elysia marginata]|uniref:Secreted protein n=1 Tax=Elysia marginata TaxID=1093978 RepID=A0AAV4FCC5_9GAST|nr:hypothetical protein ElyMa_003802800 [Elysia marginata]
MKLRKSTLWGLVFLLAANSVLTAQAADGADAVADSGYGDEGVVEQYLQDREEVEEELEEFYKTAALGDQPDQNSEAMENPTCYTRNLALRRSARDRVAMAFTR